MEPPKADQQAFTFALLDAWSLVDCIHRLRGLTQHLPGLKHRKQIPAFHNFLSSSQSVEQFRNTIQHLPDTIRKTPLASNWSLWGSLSWCIPDLVTGNIRSCTYASGRVLPSPKPLINPIGKEIRMPIGLITLTQGDFSVCLSDLMTDVEKLASELDKTCAKTFSEDARLSATYPSDSVICIDLALVPPLDSEVRPGRIG